MTHLPIALAAAVAAGAAVGIEWPSLEWLGAGVGLTGWALAVAAFLRRWPSRVVLMAALCGLSGVGVMRGAEAFAQGDPALSGGGARTGSPP